MQRTARQPSGIAFYQMWPFQSPKLSPAGFGLSALLFFSLGIFSLICGFTAAAEKRDLAHDAIVCGVGLIGVGLIIGVGFCVIRRIGRG